MVNPKQIDLLVHVSGPSDGRDDARYRAQAEAYIALEGSTAAPYFTRVGAEATKRLESRQQVQEVQDDNVGLLVHLSTPTSRVDDTKYRVQARGYIGFEATAAALQREAHPALQDKSPNQSTLSNAPAAVNTENGSRTSSDLLDPSLTSQDIRELLEFADRRARELEEQRQLEQRKTEERKAASDGNEDRERVDDGIPPCSMSFGSSFDWTSTPCFPPSVLTNKRPGPVEVVGAGSSISKRVRSPLRNHTQSFPRSHSALYPRSHGPGASPARGGQGKKENIYTDDVERTQRDLNRDTTTSHAVKERSSFTNKPIHQAKEINDAAGMNTLKQSTPSNCHPPTIEIHPPLPPTSTQPLPIPSNITTPSLEVLARKVNLNHRRFHPKHQSRPLQPLERGHWVFDLERCNISSRNLRRRFWDFLKEFIGTGRAGWGVWVELQGNTDFLKDSEAATGTRVGTGLTTTGDGNRGKPVIGSAGEKHNDQKEASSIPTSEIKIYCFGAVAIHIYALLWVASEGHLRKGRGCRWVDAKEEVVIMM